jgi:tetratricopeptide (TPR) repeat protein
MKLTPTAIAIMLGSVAAASPALAQYTSPPPAQAPDAPRGEAQAQEQAPANQPKVSSGARKEIVALQAAVNAKDTATIPTALAAANAKAKTKDDRFIIAQLQTKAAVDANDNAATIAGLQAVVASGYLSPAETLPHYMNIGKLNYNSKAFEPAAAAFDQVLKLDPNNLDAMVMLAEARNGQGKSAEAVSMIQKAIAAKTAAGQKADETWYKRAVALAFNAKMPNATDLGRQWVAAYPNPKTWRDTIRIYQTTSALDDGALLDTMRLAQATGALAGESDYFRYTDTLVKKGFPGEAKAVLEQGFAANSINKSKATFTQLYSLASTRSQGDRASLDASAPAAKAAADAKKAMVTAEAYYGYGDYQKAADMFRVALDKPGVDKDLANLRLGMSLARAGDKAGATAALNAVGGAQAGVAKLWLTYVETKA